MPKLEATLAVTTSSIKAKACLLLESAKNIMEFAINDDATNIIIRFLKAALYRIDFPLSSLSSSWISLHSRNKFIK